MAIALSCGGCLAPYRPFSDGESSDVRLIIVYAGGFATDLVTCNELKDELNDWAPGSSDGANSGSQQPNAQVDREGRSREPARCLFDLTHLERAVVTLSADRPDFVLILVEPEGDSANGKRAADALKKAGVGVSVGRSRPGHEGQTP